MTRLLSWLTGALAALVVAPAWSVPLFELPPDSVSPQGGQIVGVIAAAANFAVPGNDQDWIVSLRFWTLEATGSAWNAPTGAPEPVVVYTFWGDAGGVPSQTPVKNINGGAATGTVPKSKLLKSEVGQLDIPGDARNPFTQYLYELDLVTPIIVDRGKPYWVSFYLGANSSGILWQYSTGSFGVRPWGNANPTGILPNWAFNFSRYVSFGLVPVPGSVLLLLTGLVGLVAARGRGCQGALLPLRSLGRGHCATPP